MFSPLFLIGSLLATQAQATDWPDANRVALHQACTSAIGPEIAPDQVSQAVFCVCFLREVQAAVDADSFGQQTPEAMAAMGAAMQTCKLELVASAMQGGPGSEMFRMDEEDQATFRAACVEQRVSEGKTGDNEAHCACTIDYIAKKWTLSDMVMGDMDGNLAEAERACVSSGGSSTAPVIVKEDPPTYIVEEEDRSERRSYYARVHLTSDLPTSGTRSLFGGVSLSTRAMKSVSVGVQLQREQWVDLSVWRAELQAEAYVFGTHIDRLNIGLSAVGGVGLALGGNGLGASVGGQATLGVPLTDKVHPGFTVRVLKPVGYNGDNNGYLLQTTQLQLMLGHRL